MDTSSIKRCTKCGEQYPLTNEYFHRDNQKKNGFSPRCKTCAIKHVKQYRCNNSARIKEKNREYRITHQSSIKQYRRMYRKIHGEKLREKDREYRMENKEKIIKYRHSSHGKDIRRLN